MISMHSTGFSRKRAPLLLALLASLLFLGFLPQEPEVAPPGDKAVLYRLEGELTRTMLTTLQRSRKMAKEKGASFLIVEIDTPGGEMGLMEEIRDFIFETYQDDGIETVAFINSDADSAGALISMACRRMYMCPLGHIGSATPIAIAPGPAAPIPVPLNEDLDRKIMSRALAVFRATARETDRNEYLAQAMVDPDMEVVLARIDDDEVITTRRKLIAEQSRLGASRVKDVTVICEKGDLLNMTAQESLDLGFIDGIPTSRTDLFENFLEIDERNVDIVQPTWSEGLVDFLESIHWLLLVAGLVFIYIEFKVPGFGIPGIIGISCLAILLLGKWMTGLAEIQEILLIIIGLALVGVEIFIFPGTFVAAAIGVICVVGGMLLAFQPFLVPASPWQVDMLESNIVHMGISVLAFAVVAVILTRFLPKTPFFSRLVLDTGKSPTFLHGSAGAVDDVRRGAKVAVGAEGTVVRDLRPIGEALFDGTRLDVQSEGEYIKTGESVRVVRVTGNFIFVR